MSGSSLPESNAPYPYQRFISLLTQIAGHSSPGYFYIQFIQQTIEDAFGRVGFEIAPFETNGGVQNSITNKNR